MGGSGPGGSPSTQAWRSAVRVLLVGLVIGLLVQSASVRHCCTDDRQTADAVSVSVSGWDVDDVADERADPEPCPYLSSGGDGCTAGALDALSNSSSLLTFGMLGPRLRVPPTGGSAGAVIHGDTGRRGVLELLLPLRR